MKRIFLTVAASLIVVLVCWYGLKPFIEQMTPQPKAAPVLASATVLTSPKSLGDFSFTDTHNKPFTQASLVGHWTLLFFGYSQCPDTCPKTLATLSELWNMLPQTREANPLRFIFVSLDPKNDTPQSLQAFLNRFHSSFLGLLGDESTIQTLSKRCSTYYWQDPNIKAVRKIDHSATLLLIDPQGYLKALFSPPYQKEMLAKDLKTLLES